MCERLDITAKKNLQYHNDRLLLLNLHAANLKAEIRSLERNLVELEFEKNYNIEYKYKKFLLHRKNSESFDILVDIEKEKALIKHFEIQNHIEENLKLINNYC